MAEIKRWNDDFLKEFKTWNEEKRGNALFIEEHPEFPAYLLVNSFDPLYPHTLKDVIGEYRAVHKLDLSKLLSTADENGYSPLIYASEPKELYSFLDHLDDPYPFDLNVTLKKFQIRGFNFLKDQPVSICNWSTGTGKSVYGVAWAKYLLKTDKVDKVVVLSKSHNKENWRRQFDQIGSVVAVTDTAKGNNADTKRSNRLSLYKDNQVFIINYEKLRYRPNNEVEHRDLTGRKRPASSGDGQELEAVLNGQRVAWIWDEAPSKLKSMQTGWYKGLQKVLKKTLENRITVLTATKIERSPENVYSVVKLLDKTIWPSIAVFRSQYAKSMSNFSPWQVASWDQKKLPEIGMRLAHFTHQASKYTDPEIRAEFPEDHWEDVFIDMSPSDRKIYNAIRDGILENDTNLTISSLAPLQHVCNNPLMLAKSNSVLASTVAKKFSVSDKYCAKLDVLHDLLDSLEKTVIFSAFNDFGSKMLAPYLAKWDIPYVVYDGNEAKMQLAQDRFTRDRRIKIFLSSDKGSDSINLQEASSVIHYDIPANYSTFTQRSNRISRITSEHAHIFHYTFITVDTLEERKLSIVNRKRRWEEAIDQDLGLQSELLNDEFDVRYLLS